MEIFIYKFCVLTGAGCFPRARLVSNALIFKNIEPVATTPVTLWLPTRFECLLVCRAAMCSPIALARIRKASFNGQLLCRHAGRRTPRWLGRQPVH
jgi:hypothetical protein